MPDITPTMDTTQDSQKTMAYKCWSCTREENGTIINTLCSDSNMKVAECTPNSFGCLEALMTFGPLKHDLRHCLEDEQLPGPRDLIPIHAFDDEVYAKGCLKVKLDRF